MRFADIGANFGYYTLLGAEMVGATGHVYSFEAQSHPLSEADQVCFGQRLR
jgi:protein-L-isoaspartate O-methyltransferase